MIKKLLFFAQNRWLLLLFSGLSFVAYGGLVWLDRRQGTLRGAYTPQTIVWYIVAFGAYLCLLAVNERQPLTRRWLWGGAIIWRVMLLFTTPTLSDDIYRYLWDGYVATQGVSPYAYAIDAPELDYLDIPQRDQANNSWMASPYLPAAQALFFGVATAFPLQPVFMQAVMVIIELGAAWLLARLLALTLLPARRLLIYLWNPLVVVEVAHGAHVDAWMLALALAAIYLALRPAAVADQQLSENGSSPLSRGRGAFAKSQQQSKGLAWIFSPLLLSLGTLTKLLPVLLLPVLFWWWSWRQRFFYGAAVILLLIPFGWSAGWGISGELDGQGLFGALRIYSDQWKFNSGIFYWLALWLGRQGAADSIALAKAISAALLLLSAAAIWLLARSQRQPLAALRLMSLPLMVYAILTPTLHPWYLLILLAFLPFLTPVRGESVWIWLWAAPWIYLSGALVFSYLTYLNPLDFGELAWVRQLEWLPTLLLLLFAATAFHMDRRRKRPKSGR